MLKRCYALVIFTILLCNANQIMAQIDETFQFIDYDGNVIPDGSVVIVNELNADGQMVVPLFVKNVSGQKAAASIYETIAKKPNGEWQTCAFGNCQTLTANGYSPKSVVDANYEKNIQTLWIPETGQFGVWEATLQLHIFNIVTKTQFGRQVEVAGETIIGYGPKITIQFVYLDPSTSSIILDGLRYSLSGAYASVIGVASSNTPERMIVPATITYEGLQYTVNKVADRAFLNSEIKDVELPNTIESIGILAFMNSAITSVTMQEGIREIKHNAFASTEIIELIIPSSVKTMNRPFDDCNKLRTLIYLGSSPPSGWVATSQTFVPSKLSYSEPTYSINNASVSEMLTFPETSFVYNGRPLNMRCTNNMTGYNASLQLPNMPWDAGTHEAIISATFTKDGESFMANIPFDYTISPAKLNAKVNNISRTYGEPNPSFNVTYSGFVNNEGLDALSTIPTVSTTATPISAVGTYPITISGGAAKNYTFEYEPGVLTVQKASLSVQVEDARRVYGSDNPTFSLLFSGLKNNETLPEWTTAPKFTTTATKGSDAGTYSVGVTCDPKNYTITANRSGTLTVTKAPLTVKVNNASMDYCGTMPTYTYQYSGFVMGDTESDLSTRPSISTEATATSDAGTYTITPTGAQAKNYSFSYTPGTLTIKQRPLTVKANSASRLYGENNPTFAVSYEGFVNNETKKVLDTEPTVSTTATIQSNVGTYDIRVNGGRAKNYTLNYVNGQLNITPRNAKAFVRNYERPYGEDNPVFTIEYEGLVGNDTGASFSRQPMARTSATKDSNVGTYDIEVTGGYSHNYTLTYGSGKLTIVKAKQDFSWDQDLSNLKIGDQVLLQANASSNLPVTYTMDSERYAEIYHAGSKIYMECKAAGTFHVKAVQDGNDNYYSTQRINKEVVIVSEGEYNPTLFIKQADNGMIGTKVDKGSTFTFTVHTNTGWKIHSVSFNDKDVTSELDDDNSYTTPAITSNSTLSVVYEEDIPATVSSMKASAVRIQGTSFGARVTNATIGDMIHVYTTDGILQKAVKAETDRIDIPLERDNVYIIKVADKTLKLRH